MTRAWLALAASFALLACERSAPEPASSEVEPPPAAIEEEPDAPQLAWSATDAALMLRDAQGAIVLALACEENPARMSVEVPAFREIASEERLSFGADDEPFVFVAQLGAPSGVKAESAIPDDLLARLERAQSVTANYGAQYEGPHPAPAPEQAAAFAATCRAMAG